MDEGDDFTPNDGNNDFTPNDVNIEREEKHKDMKKVEKETEAVFKDFLSRRLISRKGFEESDMAVANIPVTLIDDLNQSYEHETDDDNIDPDQNERFQRLGRTLAQYGDVIQDRYKPTFLQMILNLNLSPDDSDFAFDRFSRIAQSLFNGGITWGRIVALLCFGYEIAISVIKQGTGAVLRFFKKIVNFVVQFFVKEQIINWIAEKGGWLVGFVGNLSDPTINNSQIWMERIGALAIILTVTYSCYRYYNGQS